MANKEADDNLPGVASRCNRLKRETLALEKEVVELEKKLCATKAKVVEHMGAIACSEVARDSLVSLVESSLALGREIRASRSSLAGSSKALEAEEAVMTSLLRIKAASEDLRPLIRSVREGMAVGGGGLILEQLGHEVERGEVIGKVTCIEGAKHDIHHLHPSILSPLAPLLTLPITNNTAHRPLPK